MLLPLSLSLSPSQRPRSFKGRRDDKLNFTNQSGPGRTAHKMVQKWTRRKFHLQHATIQHCRSIQKKIANVIPTCWWTTTFPLMLIKKNRPPIRQRIPGNGFSRPSFRRACNPMCVSNLWSVLAIQLLLKFRPKHLCSDSAWVPYTIFPYASTN